MQHRVVLASKVIFPEVLTIVRIGANELSGGIPYRQTGIGDGEDPISPACHGRHQTVRHRVVRHGVLLGQIVDHQIADKHAVRLPHGHSGQIAAVLRHAGIRHKAAVGVESEQHLHIGTVHVHMALGAADLGGYGQHPGAVEIGGDQRPVGGQFQPGSGLVQHVEGRAANVIGHGQTASLSQRRGVHLHVGAPHLAAVRSQQPQGRIRQDDQ